MDGLSVRVSRTLYPFVDFVFVPAKARQWRGVLWGGVGWSGVEWSGVGCGGVRCSRVGWDGMGSWPYNKYCSAP